MFVFAHHGTYLDSLLISFAGKFLSAHVHYLYLVPGERACSRSCDQVAPRRVLKNDVNITSGAGAVNAIYLFSSYSTNLQRWL